MAKESRDQRRKKKLADERRKALRNQSSAYLGEKYKTDELIPTWMHTEIGIYQTYVMSGHTLLDQAVVDALERLIGMMRTGPLPPLPDGFAGSGGMPSDTRRGSARTFPRGRRGQAEFMSAAPRARACFQHPDRSGS